MVNLAQELRNKKEKIRASKAESRWTAVRAIIDNFVASRDNLQMTDEDNPQIIFDPVSAITANAIPIGSAHMWKQELEFVLRTLSAISGLSVEWNEKRNKFYLSLPTENVVVVVPQEPASDTQSAANGWTNDAALMDLMKQLGY